MARLVSNHSTYIPGLAKVLKKMSESSVINTITPGRMYTAAHTQSMLELRLTTSTIKTSERMLVEQPSQAKHSTGSISQKILARCESSVQEVFVIYPVGSFVEDNANNLAAHLRQELKKEQCKIVVQERTHEGRRKELYQKPKSRPLSETEKLLKTDLNWLA